MSEGGREGVSEGATDGWTNKWTDRWTGVTLNALLSVENFRMVEYIFGVFVA